MASFANDLRLKEITTGDEDGTWGDSTNENLGLVADAFSLGTKQMAADADESFTMPDAVADGTRSLFLKITSAVSLTVTRTVTLLPNTVSKVWIIENATTGSQIITIAQGSGATINVPNGSKVMVVTDGAGAGAAVFNANPTTTAGTVTSVGGTGTVNGISLSGTVTSSGNLTLGGTLAIAATQVTSGTFADARIPNLNASKITAGTLVVARGGTGQASYTNGQLLIGNSTGNTLAKATLTAGTGVTITNGTGTITVAATNNGTVTSVGGTGTVNGLTLTGTVTSTGNLTLGGTLAIAATQVTSGAFADARIPNLNASKITAGTLAVARGGTGVTTSTGTGATVRSTSPTLVTPVLGTPTSGNLSNCTVDGTNLVGFKNIPQNSRSAAYTLVLTDAGKHIFHPAADTTNRTFTIPPNSSVAFPIGTALTFINQNGSGGIVTIAITTDTMRLAGAGTTGSRTLARNGVATCVKITSTEWIISGTGLT